MSSPTPRTEWRVAHRRMFRANECGYRDDVLFAVFMALVAVAFANAAIFALDSKPNVSILCCVGLVLAATASWRVGGQADKKILMARDPEHLKTCRRCSRIK